MNDQLALLTSLAISALIGALIGLEREYSHRLKREMGFAGLRTFMFFAVLGNLSTWLSRNVDPVILPVAFGALIVLLAVIYFHASAEAADRGMTTEVAALLTFLLGCLVSAGETEVAVALGVTIAALLSAKPALVRGVERLTTEDIYTTIKFAVIMFVVLPILPNRSYGPFAALNPYNIWLMVVLISGVSFLGYVALKLLGPHRGIAASGLLGGLASSTAVAVSFSRRSKESPEFSRSCALAIVVASTVMAARIAALVGVANPSLFRVLWLPLTAIGVSGVAVSFWLWLGSRHAPERANGLSIRNPFRLPTVIAFGAAYAVVLFVVKASIHLFPAGGAELVGAISGLTQVDAITLSVAKLARESMDPAVAGTAILFAALSNTVAKAVIGFTLGDRGIRKPLGISLGVMFLAGFATLPFILRG